MAKMCVDKKKRQYELLFDKYNTDVFRLVMHHLRDYAIAQEITQMVFVQFYKHMELINLEYARTWLVRTTMNRISNYVRDTRHEVPNEDVMSMSEELVQEFSAEKHVIQRIQRRESIELCHQIMDRLHEKHPLWHEALTYVYILEKPIANVAEELEVSSEVLYSRLYRAKQWIRKHYAKEYKSIINF